MSYTTGFTIYYPVSEACGHQVLKTPAGVNVVVSTPEDAQEHNLPNTLQIIETYTCGSPSYQGLPPNADS
jgi:hypothetical protein